MLKTCLHCGVEFEGSAQAKFHSDACRKAHARQVDPELPVVDLNEAGPVERLRREAPVSFERYVEDAVAAALRFSEAIGETDEPLTVGEGVVVTNRRRDRLERAKRYAEWRYKGFVAGEVAGL